MKPKWKPGHPQEDGVYWLSVTPKHREPTHWEQAWIPINDAWFDGAKWSRRETPADPFEEG